MRFAFFGDVVGRSGREGLAEHLPGLRRRLGLEFVIVNADGPENPKLTEAPWLIAVASTMGLNELPACR